MFILNLNNLYNYFKKTFAIINYIYFNLYNYLIIKYAYKL